MWGTHEPVRLICPGERFIPTHVGNTLQHFGHKIPQSVHPHACGEHPSRTRRRSNNLGSSPRMWGTRGWIDAGFGGTRFIPTHVGNTYSKVFILFEMSVHPHACGEHSSPYLPKQEPSFLVLLNNLIVTQHISRSDVIHSCSSLYSERGEINLTKKQAKGPPLQG